MYLAYIDESGSHGAFNNRAYVLAAVVVHESDASRLQTALSDVLNRHSVPDDLELHAAEIGNPSRLRRSRWVRVPRATRRAIVSDAVRALADFEPGEGRIFRLLGVTADPGNPNCERLSYEALLNRFDDLVAAEGNGDLGLAISDVSARAGPIQRLANRWRNAPGPLGQLDAMVDVPFFSDSNASRLLQAADLVAWSLWRCVGSKRSEKSWASQLAPRVEASGGLHHVTEAGLTEMRHDWYR